MLMSATRISAAMRIMTGHPPSAMRFSVLRDHLDSPIHSNFSPCPWLNRSFSTASKSAMTSSRSVSTDTRWSISR